MGCVDRRHIHEVGREIKLESHDGFPEDLRKAVYARSAYRNDPEFISKTVSDPEDKLERTRFTRMIDNDASVGTNYKRLFFRVVEHALVTAVGTSSIDEFRQHILGDIRGACKKLFEDLDIDDLGVPDNNGTFRFTKGSSKGFAYMNLSSGEKAAFDLILDLVVSQRVYNNTLFCIDEPETHLNARLQADLLSVLYSLISDNCQLILATHSIGIMRRAQELEQQTPGSVVFLDFDNKDFDNTVTIEPATPDREFWNNANKIALSDMAAYVAPKQIIICEGKPLPSISIRHNQEYSLDATCYNEIFKVEFPDTLFISMGNIIDVSYDRHFLARALRIAMKDLVTTRLIDRDQQTTQGIKSERDLDMKVLTRTNLESYLFDNTVLEKLAIENDAGNKISELLSKKDDLLNSLKAHQRDNLKLICRELFNECKTILELSKSGRDVNDFMCDCLSPLITRDMGVYNELKNDIFGKEQNEHK